MIIEKDGVLGLMGRGLKTKIIANGLQVRRLALGCSGPKPVRPALVRGLVGCSPGVLSVPRAVPCRARKLIHG